MTATRCRPPTLRDLSTELTFEVADFCSGSKGEILARSRCFPLFTQQRTSPGRSIPGCIQQPADVPLAELERALIQPTTKQFVP
jgi:hypothetical protein